MQKYVKLIKASQFTKVLAETHKILFENQQIIKSKERQRFFKAKSSTKSFRLRKEVYINRSQFQNKCFAQNFVNLKMFEFFIISLFHCFEGRDIELKTSLALLFAFKDCKVQEPHVLRSVALMKSTDNTFSTCSKFYTNLVKK